MGEEVQRDLGKHEAQIEALERDVRDLRDEIAELRREFSGMRADFTTALATINATLSEAKGGWRVLMMVGGASAAVGGLVVKLSAWFNTLPK